MEQIGFIGVYDKKDLLLNVANLMSKLNKRVLIVDATIMQRLRYIVPKISATPTIPLHLNKFVFVLVE